MEKLGKLQINKSVVLGKGGFSTIYGGSIRLPDGQEKQVAIKEIAKKDFRPIEDRILEMKHDHIVAYLVKEEYLENWYIAMELCAGTLFELVEGTYNGSSPGTTTEVLIQITKGLRFLHSKQIVHRDIKPVNILISIGEKPKMKLADFGLSKSQERQDGITYTGGLGTVGWAAPELLQLETGEPSSQKLSFTLAVDIFSLGCVFAYCLTHQHPFGDDKVRRSDKILQGKTDWSKECEIKNENYKRLIKKMISREPCDRPTLKLDDGQLDDEATPNDNLERFFLPDYSSTMDKSSDDYRALLRTIAGTYIGAGKEVHVAVAWTIKNRLNYGWGDTLAEICLQEGEYAVLPQQSVEKDLAEKPAMRELDSWLPAVYAEHPVDPTGGATHCYAFKGRYKQDAPDFFENRIGDHCDISYMRFFRLK